MDLNSILVGGCAGLGLALVVYFLRARFSRAEDWAEREAEAAAAKAIVYLKDRTASNALRAQADASDARKDKFLAAVLADINGTAPKA